jgi:serine/threonine protein kinase
MPPEYINSGIILRKFDVFSLGLIIIEILAGNRGYSRRYEMSQKQFTELVRKKIFFIYHVDISVHIVG